MLIKIHKNRSVSSSGTWGTKNENNYEILDFEFPEELEEYNKRIVYYLGNQKVWDPIIDNKAILTNAITTKESVKAYIWCTKSDEAFETDVDFRTQLFEMNFFENENADGIVPTEEQIDGFNTMLTAMNEKIEEIDELENTIKNAETQRQENEETRQNNEKTRQENEQTRQNQEAERERRTDKAIADIKDKTAEYNQNAQEKTEAFNTNASQKTNDFNNNYTQKVNEFNSNASSKTSDFNSNAETKTNAFNTNATNKTNNFNNNATEKTSEFNTNAENKTSAFNDNATQKTTNFNNNASEKTNEFNTNAQEKINEYDEHIVEYQAQIDELQEEVEELNENMPWNTTEQATEISVDDAAKYSRNKLEIFGNTSQKSYQGYNLVDVSPYQEETKNGVTLTKDEEGNLIFNGTATTGTSFFVNLPETKVLPAGTYTKSITKDTNIGSKLTVSIGYGGSAITGTSIQPLAGIGTMTFEQDTSYTQLRMYIASGTTLNNFKLNYMILSGEYTLQTIPDYEPYVGGVPAPNPSFPQDIHVVSGNNIIRVEAENLFNKNNVINNYYLNQEGTAVSNGAWSVSPYIEVQSNLLYSYSGLSNAGQLPYSCFYDANKNILSTFKQQTGFQTMTIPDNARYLRFSILKTDLNDFKITKGTIIETDYLIDFSGKNKFDITKIVPNTYIQNSGNTGESQVSNLSDYILVKGNKKYIISYEYDTLRDTANRNICFYNINKSYISGQYISMINKSVIFTPVQDGYIRFSYDKNCYDIQVEEGDTATEYVPYTSLELCKISSKQDYLYKENSNWYKHGAISKFVWNGETIRATGNHFYISNLPKRYLRSASNYADRYIWVGYGSGFNNMPNYHIGMEGATTLHIQDQRFTTTIELRAEYQQNPLVAYMPLETPEITQITDETLIAQLDAIYEHLKLVKGTNNITVTAEDLAPYMELSYMQDLPSKLDNLDSRLALLE